MPIPNSADGSRKKGGGGRKGGKGRGRGKEPDENVVKAPKQSKFMTTNEVSTQVYA